VLQYVAVDCGALQCVAICNMSPGTCFTRIFEYIDRVGSAESVLQCVAVYCSELQCVTVCCSVLQCVAGCCNMSPGTCFTRKFEHMDESGLCCSLLQCVAVNCSVLQ